MTPEHTTNKKRPLGGRFLFVLESCVKHPECVVVFVDEVEVCTVFVSAYGADINLSPTLSQEVN